MGGKRRFERIDDDNDLVEYTVRTQRTIRGLRVLTAKSKVTIPNTSQSTGGSAAPTSSIPGTPTTPLVGLEASDPNQQHRDDDYPIEWIGRDSFARSQAKVRPRNRALTSLLALINMPVVST